jgi:transposase InsO family protein
MISQVSPATGRAYPVTMLCEVYGVARSTFYAAARTPVRESPPKKRGPRTKLTDDQLVEGIRQTLRERPFHGEGHRKVHAVLRHRKDVRVGRNLVLRLMRQEGLLAPTRRGHPHGDKAHEGSIVTQRPNQIWGTDATRFETEENGGCWFFGAIDHYCDDILGWSVAKIGDRFQALEPIRQGLGREYGALSKDVARGLTVRCDHGSQYVSHDFRAELAYFGISISYAYVGEPEGNGIAERFMRTLKEQVLHCHRFKNLEEARRVIGEFIERYNREWLIERLGYVAPSEARRRFLRPEDQAA